MLASLLPALGIWLAASTPAPLPAWAAPVTVGNVRVMGMLPTEIVEWTPLETRSDSGNVLAVVFAKASTDQGETVLDAVLATKHSIGIYAYQPQAHLWLPVWERVTGQLGVDFVEGFEVLDMNGDGRQDVGVRVRYYGEGRALDFIALTVAEGNVREMFEAKSVYQGTVTAAAGYIVIGRPQRETAGERRLEIYAWNAAGRAFKKVRELRRKDPE